MDDSSETGLSPDIVVSIVVHGTAPSELLRAVGCALRSPRVARVEVVDNGPDRSLEAVVSGVPRVSYRHVENRGYGAGHNLSIRESIASGTRYHLVMNADVEWQGDVPGRLVAYMDTHPRVAMMMPKVFYPDGALQLTARRLPTPWDLFAKRFLPRRLVRRRMDRYLLARADHDRIIDSPYLLGSFLLFRASALEAGGAFDERFFMYPEDIDITRRLHARWQTLYFPEVNIIHRHAAASRRSLRMLLVHLTNMARYFNKWGWWHDPERRVMNRRLEESLILLPEDELPDQRG